MSKIITIEQLIESFDASEPSEQIKVLKRIDIPKSAFEEYMSWTEGGYTRNCVVRRDGFEFILLCWDKDAETPIHDHAGQNCWVYQVDGTVRERRYEEADFGFKLTNEAVLSEGKISYMHDRMGYHTLENISGRTAMTLHVYANPIDRCKVYDEEKSQFEVREMQYDTIEGEEVRQTGS